MKQIKVYITAEQWADKRLQLICHDFNIEIIDSVIKKCGFELIEAETKNEQPQPSEIPTDKVEAVKYFLNQLPSGYRERALEQIKDVTALVDNIIDAIREFRVWADTKEGRQFWRQVYKHYLNPYEYPTLPPLPND